jgi:hypothetical protein
MPEKKLFPEERAKLGKIDTTDTSTYTEHLKRNNGKDFISSSEAFFAAVEQVGRK